MKMGKIITLSIKPVFTDEIYNGSKHVELRRSIGSFFRPDAEVLIYSTSPKKAITGKAVIEKIELVPVKSIIRNYLKEACIDSGSCINYFKGKELGYLIWLTNVIRFTEPLNLSELKGIGFTAPQSFSYATQDLITLVNSKCQ